MKLISRDQIPNVVRINKAAGKTLVFTNGCFDIIHAGHVRYLAEARKLGDCLIVGLNSDRSVQELKGPTRPVNHQDDRAEVMGALAVVDCVVVFDERTAENLISEIKPDIYVKGGDYCIEDIPEVKIVASNGGKTVLIPEVVGRSSSNIIKKISEST